VVFSAFVETGQFNEILTYIHIPDSFLNGGKTSSDYARSSKGYCDSTARMTVAGQRLAVRTTSDLVRLDPAIQISPIKMDPPAFSHHDEFASVDQVLYRLHRATDVGRCVLDG
jgi:hypothetical protein